MAVARHILLQSRLIGGGAGAIIETFERYHAEDLATATNYVPGDPGLFSASLESVDLSALLQDGGAVWRDSLHSVFGNDAVVGDGANLAFWHNAGAARNLAVMRHHISTGTYEMYHTADIAAGANYVPGDEGLFSHGSELNYVDCEYKYNAAWWKWATQNSAWNEIGVCLGIGDGTNLRYRNTDGANARWTVIMRHVASIGVETFERYHVEDLAADSSYTPSDDGLFSSAIEYTGVENLSVRLQDNSPSWQTVLPNVRGNNAIIGDGTNLKFYNAAGAASNLVVMRHHLSTGTYERYNTQDLAAGASYIPANEGLFSHAGESSDIRCEYQYSPGVWWYWYVNGGISSYDATCLGIGDGTNLRYRNTDGANARWTVIMRHLMN